MFVYKTNEQIMSCLFSKQCCVYKYTTKIILCLQSNILYWKKNEVFLQNNDFYK